MLIETVLDAHAVIGKSPTWMARQNALYWIDVTAPARRPIFWSME